MKRVFRLSEVKSQAKYLTPTVREFEPVYLPGDRLEFNGRVWAVVFADEEKDLVQLED